MKPTVQVNTHKPANKQKGFTLIELIVAVAIVGILVTLATPSFQSLIQSNRIQGAATEFQAAMALARSEAIKRGADAKVTVLANVLDGSRSWNNGYSVFVDRSLPNASLSQLETELNKASATSRNELLMSVPAMNNTVNFTDNSNQFYLTYNGLGRTVQTNGAQLSASYQFSPSTGSTDSDTRCIILNVMGRIRSAKLTPTELKSSTYNNKCPVN